MRIDGFRGWIDGRSFAGLWLMTRKRPGKICRQAAVSLLKANALSHRSGEIYSIASTD
jgi:hypothetical protein